MYRRLFHSRTCKHCRKGFEPVYSNQRVHLKCREVWRKKYLRAYQRKYQRKVRRELKEEFAGQGNYAT